MLKHYETELQKDVALVSQFGEFRNIIGTLDDEEMIPEQAL